MNLDEALQEIADLKAKNADISRNFSSYRKIAEDKEEDFTKQIETLKTESEKSISEKTKELETFTQKIEEEKKAQRTSFMEKKIEEMSKGDPKIADQLKAEYAVLNIPEDSEESISTRLDKARTIVFASSNNPTAVGDVGGAGS